MIWSACLLTVSLEWCTHHADFAKCIRLFIFFSRLLQHLVWLKIIVFLTCHMFRVPSADSVRTERIGSVNPVTSYSAGTERTTSASAGHSQLGHHRHAWTSSPSGGSSTFPLGKPPLPPLSRGSNFSDTSPQHVLSKKEEDLSEEWLVDFMLISCFISKCLVITVYLNTLAVSLVLKLFWNRSLSNVLALRRF